MNLRSQDYLAKLLAKENLTVAHGNFSTASFDVENRVLNLPLWADKGKDVYDLLVGHEVGHALYTPADGWHDSDKEIPGVPRSMINIIEDIRIERKIQNTYPGIVRAFKSGYKKLFDDNLFGTEGKDISKMNFMDRLNIYSKGRGYAPVEFTDTEQMFVDLAMAVDTWDDVLNACQEISDWLKNKDDYEDEQEQEIESTEQGNENESTEESDSMEQGGQDDRDDEGPTKEEPVDQFISETDQAYRDNEGDLLETDKWGKQPVFSSGISKENLDKIPTSYAELNKARLSLTYDSVYVHPELPAAYKTMVNDDIIKTVNLMAREFERKKAAWEYSRSSEAKKGSLNVNKIHQYQYSEDIFLNVQRLAQAKSHGIFMLIDWSGSMYGLLEDVVKQTITIALFCKKVNIPFEAYSFTTSRSHMVLDDVKGNEIDNINLVKLVQVISSDLKRAAFDESLMHLWGSTLASGSYNNNPFYFSKTCQADNTGGTPLIQSVIACEPLINKMKAKKGIQNMNVMVLTDGLADSVSINRSCGLDGSKVNTDTMTIQFGRKQITGKNKPELTANTIKTLGELTGAKTLGFFLAGNKHDFNYGLYQINNDKQSTTYQEGLKVWRRDGVLSYGSTLGYDEYFIVKVGGKAAPTEFEVSEKATQIKDIKREFRKFAKRGVQSKQLVNKITDAVAA